MLAFDNVVFRISGQGYDERKLGRWGFLTIAGKNNTKTTIDPLYGSSPGLVYKHHLVHMAENAGNIP